MYCLRIDLSLDMTFDETASSGLNLGFVSVAKLLQNIPETKSVKTRLLGSPFFRPLGVEPGSCIL